ncbi:Tetratricopeptide repeat-containing protein [Selenomonas ruminantium]|uniref:Tetratricopeptide repeat-containing protein n=1 Tax=Selenomonas ruminantium TaxID=971 RepID=A0A1M6TL15_SELRU|nr:glucosaminidase domain-containing protein [Selenomonas ruminantium]SHK57579.1 Tetratricopeptide repeat-containing protein [Selenomonas ruminantium]
MRLCYTLIPLLSLSCLLMPACAFSKEQQAVPVAQRTIAGRPDFPEKMPGEINPKIIQGVHFRYEAAFDEPMMATDTTPETVTIMGPAEATQEQMTAFIRKRNPNPKINCTLEEMVNYYYQEAGAEGVRPDVALCQALKETGFFAYGGDVSPQQNNFCGLGATGNHEPGHSFATAQLGVRAHIQHLLAYAKYKPPVQAIIDPRYQHVVKNRPDLHGKVLTWTKLNGNWAVPGKNYGQEILMLWREAQAPDGSDAALAAAQKKVSQAPDEAINHIYRGVVYYNRDDFKNALDDFKAAKKFSPTSGEALFDLAITAEKLGEKRTARKTYDELIKLHPNFNQAYYNRALLRYQAKDYDGAIADLQALLKIEERTADAMNLIGLCHIAQKQYSAAWDDFAAAGKINSANMNVLANQFIMMACLK